MTCVEIAEARAPFLAEQGLQRVESHVVRPLCRSNGGFREGFKCLARRWAPSSMQCNSTWLQTHSTQLEGVGDGLSRGESDWPRFMHVRTGNAFPSAALQHIASSLSHVTGTDHLSEASEGHHAGGRSGYKRDETPLFQPAYSTPYMLRTYEALQASSHRQSCWKLALGDKATRRETSHPLCSVQGSHVATNSSSRQ